MTHTHETNTLIFDFFGVICSEVAPFWLARYFPAERAAEIKRDLVTLADKGEISQDELFLRLGRISGQTATVVADEWMQHVSIDESMLRLLDECRQDFRIALLTNSPAPFVRQILSNFDLTRRFESILVSSEVSLAKPDHRIYAMMLQRMQVAATECLMIDDNARNVEGAISVGMRGYHFLNELGLKETLQRLRGDAQPSGAPNRPRAGVR